jgi:hypothetical protein
MLKLQASMAASPLLTVIEVLMLDPSLEFELLEFEPCDGESSIRHLHSRLH